MNTHPIVINETSPITGLRIVWVKTPPFILRFSDKLKKRYFVKYYLKRLNGLSMEYLLNDAVSFRMFTSVTQNSECEKTYARLMCHELCKLLLEDGKRFTDENLWDKLKQYCSAEDWNKQIINGLTTFRCSHEREDLTMKLKRFKRELCYKLGYDKHILTLKK